MDRSVKTKELFSNIPAEIAPLFAETIYPWEALPRLKALLLDFISHAPAGYTKYSEDVLIGENVKIYPSATIEGPAVIGDGCEIRPGAFIRGNVFIGKNCVIGNSSELKSAILFDRVQVPHYNYIGDSILGYKAHTGAGTICSNLKTDGKNVVVHGDCDYDTGLRKLGGILADGADIGCGAVLNPGTVIGKNTSAYPLTPLRGVYPANVIIKETNKFVPRKVAEAIL